MIKELFELLLLLLLGIIPQTLISQPSDVETPEITIIKTGDFEITGDGSAGSWTGTDWIELTQRNNLQGDGRLETKVKMLYSNTGIYVLFQSEDRMITTPFTADFEVTPLNYELPLIVSNIDGELLSWIPFDNTYREGRKVRHKTTVTNGVKENGASIDSWTAEFFIPYKLLYPLDNIYPAAGTTWRANFYRIDYDDEVVLWSWSPFEGNFHDYQNFGVLVFE